MDITSHKNPHVKGVVKLRSSSHRRKLNRFVIEGPRCVGRAMEMGIDIEQAFFCRELLAEGLYTAMRAQLAATGARCFDTPANVFATMAYREHPEGVLAVAVRPDLPLNAFEPVDNPLYVVAESLEKPGNLGAILRSADGAGADGLILCDKHTDIFNPNVIRSSTGTLFSVPIAEASADEMLQWCRQRGVKLLAATPDGGCDYTQADLTGPVAVVLGSEHDGLSEHLEQAADLRVTIPMAGLADSLNVAQTATILLFEAARQRRNV